MTDDVRPSADDAQLVLVTGATGHVGGYSVARLIDEGYQVRVSVRELSQQNDVLARVRQAGAAPDGRVEFVATDLSSDRGWVEAADGVRFVLHHASPFPFTPPENEDELIRPARDGTLRVLAAARAAGVRRVVLTSSFAAVGYTVKPDSTYDETDWTNPADDIPAYIKSKTIAEKAAWDDIRKHGGPELTVINPTGIFGPLLGTKLSAMRHPAAANQRFIAVGGPSISFLDMAKMLALHCPTHADRVPASELTDEEVREGAKTNPALREAATLRGRIPIISNDKARTTLGWHPREVETTITDTADSLLRLGLVSP